jgi:hypothetical protein
MYICFFRLAGWHTIKISFSEWVTHSNHLLPTSPYKFLFHILIHSMKSCIELHDNGVMCLYLECRWIVENKLNSIWVFLLHFADWHFIVTLFIYDGCYLCNNKHLKAFIEVRIGCMIQWLSRCGIAACQCWCQPKLQPWFYVPYVHMWYHSICLD